MGKLTDMKIRSALKSPGVYGDGAGLYLRVKPTGAASWVLRVQFNGRRQDIGLGGYPADRSLGEAREEAYRLRKLARRGGDALAERDKDKVSIPTFAEVVERAHAELGKGWAEKTAEQFKSSLETHANPRIGKKRVDQIQADHVIAALSPIWTEKPQIARKVRHRIMQTLAFAKSHGWRSDPVPTAKEISGGLASQPASQGFRAMPYRELPSFIASEIAKDDSPARLALLFTILTAARSGEARKATWAEIDFEDQMWRRPAQHMKSRKAHDIPLSAAALAILERTKSLSDGEGLIFPNSRGKALSDAALGKMMASAKRTETVHGFRSTFRDWAAEKMPTVPFTVAEIALAHSVGDATERAYLRSDLREMRRSLMDAWAAFAAPSIAGLPQNVTAIRAS